MDYLKLLPLISLLHLACGFPVAGYAARYPVGQTYTYNYVTETLFNEPQNPRGKKDVGVKFTGRVELTPVWNNNQHMIVKLSVTNPHAYLESISRKDVQQQLKTLPKLPIYFVWSDGQIGAVYSEEKDLDVSVNLKKGVASLFQLVNVKKDKTEVDASGECSVHYDVNDEIIRKTKTNCVAKHASITNSVHQVLQVSRVHKAETVYKLKNDVIETAETTEHYSSSLNLMPHVGTSVTVKTQLNLNSKGRAKHYEADTIESAMTKIAKGEGLNLILSTLSTQYERTCHNCSSFTTVLSQQEARLTPDQSGSIPTAYAVLELIQAAQHATQQELMNVLKNSQNKEYLPLLIDAVGAAQTTETQKTMASLLDFKAEEEVSLQERYLLACALSTYPHQDTVQHLLKLFKMKVPNSKLRESIGEALGTVAKTLYLRSKEHSSIINEVQRAFMETLEQCADDLCQCMQIRALGNTAIPESIPVLLNYAESNKTLVSEAAIKALRHFSVEHLARVEVQDVAKRIFLETSQGFDTAIRSHALSILLMSEPSTQLIVEILRSSRNPWNTDYDKYIQARVLNAMALDDKFRAAAETALKSPEFRNWNMFAPKGKALAFTSWLAKTPHWSVPYLSYMENTRSGVSKRTGMDVDITDSSSTLPLYKFGLFASGMESLLGEEVDDPDETATAGLALDIMGMSLRPITFFEGSSGLLSAVWSAPSEPVSALQVNILTQDFSQWLPLHNGFVVEVSAKGSLSLDLGGSLTVSLWNKNAQCFIINKGALAVRGYARLATAGSSLQSGMTFNVDGSSVITFQTDVNFYDGIQTCLQMYRPKLQLRHKVEKYESAFGLKHSYKSRIKRVINSPGVCYPLPDRSNKECRAMFQEHS